MMAQAKDLVVPSVEYTKLFISNQFVDSQNQATFPTINPATLETLAHVQEARFEDVDIAVGAAKEALKFGSRFRRMDASQRALMLLKWAQLIEDNIDHLARLESINCGKLVGDAAGFDIPTAIAGIRFFAGAADKIGGSVVPCDGNNFSYTRHEPIGVVAAITPWNYPIEMACLKIAPAIAMGNAVILKPAEQSPLTALYLASLAIQAGFPPGILAVLPGFGPIAGHALVQHPDVAMVTFTGSVEVGKLIQSEAAKTLKRVSLELGGKSPLIVFPDADIDKAVSVAHKKCMINQGQCCVAATRTYVHESIYEEFVNRTISMFKDHYVIGDPLDPNTNHGPQIDREQYSKIMDLIESATKEGAKLLMGGKAAREGSLFIEPTVFSSVTDDMRVAREEIFGPVQVIMKFGSKEEVIERANNSSFGLGAGVFTRDVSTAIELSARLEAGQVYINEFMIGGVQMPFGGFKQSGIGREYGLDGLSQYYQVKSVIIDMPVKI